MVTIDGSTKGIMTNNSAVLYFGVNAGDAQWCLSPQTAVLW